METISKLILFSFLLKEKKQKFKTANKLLNFCFISWQRINSPAWIYLAMSGLKQYSLLIIPFRKIF